MNLLQDLMSPEMAFMRCALLVGLLGGNDITLIK